MGDILRTKGLLAGLYLLYFAAMGCGGKSSTTPVCKLSAIRIFPASATIDHTAPPAGNTQHFDAFASASTPVLGCFDQQCSRCDLRHRHLQGRDHGGSHSDGNRSCGRRDKRDEHCISHLQLSL